LLTSKYPSICLPKIFCIFEICCTDFTLTARKTQPPSTPSPQGILVSEISYPTLQMKGRWESKMSGSHLCIHKNVTLQPPYFQNRIIMFCLPIPTLIYTCEISIFTGSVCLFCCSQKCKPNMGIYKSLADTWMWKWGLRGRTVPRKGIHKWDFFLHCHYLLSLYAAMNYIGLVHQSTKVPLGRIQEGSKRGAVKWKYYFLWNSIPSYPSYITPLDFDPTHSP
jgi:hypothetical protein